MSSWPFLSEVTLRVTELHARHRQSANRLARALGVTLADFFSVFDESFRLRFRKERRDLQASRAQLVV
jgi:hypothetical protein